MIILAAAAVAAFSWTQANTILSVLIGCCTLIGIAATAVRRVLKRIEGTVTAELTHNGGSSMKDFVREARDEARAARVAAEYANDRVGDLEEKFESHTHGPSAPTSLKVVEA